MLSLPQPLPHRVNRPLRGAHTEHQRQRQRSGSIGMHCDTWVTLHNHPHPYFQASPRFVDICVYDQYRLFHIYKRLAIMALLPNFVFPYICSFLYYLYLKILVNVKLDCQVVKGITFIGLFNFEWHGQDRVGNIAILVL